jgi:hypothetical protein
MFEDPIVEEVRRIRGELYDQCGGDLDRLAELYRMADERHGGQRIGSVEELREYFEQQEKKNAVPAK